VAYFLHGLDWDALGQAISAARVLPLAGFVFVTLAVYGIRAWRWGDLLAPILRVRYADLLSATMAGFASSLVIPRVGEVLRPWFISRHYAVSISAGFATIIIERLVDVIAVLLMLALYLLILGHPAEQGRAIIDGLKLAGILCTAAAVLVLAFLLALHTNADRLLPRLERLLSRGPSWLAQRAAGLLRAFTDGLVVLRAPGAHLALIGGQSLVVWLVTALGYHLVHLAFGIELPFHATFLLIAFLIVGEAIPTPGMVGGFHAFYLLALAEVYGIDRATSAAAAIAAHALANLPVLIIGLPLIGRYGLRIGRIAEVAAERDPLKLPRG
jgi:glycosyltransferase 2 family protein